METSDLKSRLSKALDFLKVELSQIRTGKANPALIENVHVSAYDTQMTVKELGSITVPDAQNIVISPWDKGLLGAIAKAIRESELKLSPLEDNDKIRVPVPTLTEERRKELAKLVTTRVEECKNVLRNIRQDAMKDIERDFTEKKIGEDDKFARKEGVEKVVKEFVDLAAETGENKTHEILTV